MTQLLSIQYWWVWFMIRLAEVFGFLFVYCFTVAVCFHSMITNLTFNSGFISFNNEHSVWEPGQTNNRKRKVYKNNSHWWDEIKYTLYFLVFKRKLCGSTYHTGLVVRQTGVLILILSLKSWMTLHRHLICLKIVLNCKNK